RIGLQGGRPGRAHPFSELGELFLVGGFEVQVLQDIRARQRREIHNAHAVTSRVTLSPRYWPVSAKLTRPPTTATTCTRCSFSRGSQRPRARATSACTALFQPSFTGRST